MSAEVRSLADAQHEAAHIVVGLALGLRLRKAKLGDGWVQGVYSFGVTWFCLRGVSSEADALVSAAGIAWEQAVKGDPYRRGADAAEARAQCSGRHGYEIMIKAAAAILATRMREHALVTRALLEGDLDAERIADLVSGDGG